MELFDFSDNARACLLQRKSSGFSRDNGKRIFRGRELGPRSVSRRSPVGFQRALRQRTVCSVSLIIYEAEIRMKSRGRGESASINAENGVFTSASGIRLGLALIRNESNYGGSLGASRGRRKSGWDFAAFGSRRNARLLSGISGRTQPKKGAVHLVKFSRTS